MPEIRAVKINERFEWATEVLDIQPGDRILEIGCGAGIAVRLIASRLKKGSITAIDQSAAMIRMATRRNREFSDAKKSIFLTGSFADTKLPYPEYDKIFAFNVSVFWKNPVTELAIIAAHLKKNGHFYLFHQPPFDITKDIAKKAAEQIRKNGFDIVNTLFKNTKPVPSFCIIANKNGL